MRHTKCYRSVPVVQLRTDGSNAREKLTKNARNMLEVGDIVEVSLIDRDGSFFRREVKITKITRSRLIGIVGPGYGLQRNMYSGDITYICEQCDFDLCEKCVDKRLHCHKLTKQVVRGSKWRRCEGRRCYTLMDGSFITFKKSAILSISSETKNGQRIHNEFAYGQYTHLDFER